MLSFTNYSAVSEKWRFIGFDNYVRALHDSTVGAALLRTALVPVVVVPLTVALGLVLALLANQEIKLRSTFRVIYYLPVVVPPVAGAVAFRSVFDRDSGAANALLAKVGVAPVDWLSGNTVLVVLIFMIAWTAGGNMVLSLAALQDVPQDIIDGATLDGAGPVRRLFHIIIPMISPVLFYQVLMGTIAALQIAVPALLLGGFGGGFPEGLDVIMVHILREFWSFGRLGYASALMWLMFVLLTVVAWVLMRLNRRYVHYSVDPGGDS